MKRLNEKHRIYKEGESRSFGSSRIILEDGNGKYFVKMKGELKELSLYLNKNNYPVFTLIEKEAIK